MFDELRDSLRALSSRLDPDERRRMGQGMREAMVHAKLAINDMRAALATTEQRLRVEEGELATVRRRQSLAADIGDQETVAIAERFAAQHAERVAVLETKRMAQQQELALAEREYEAMSSDLRQILSGVAPGGESPDAAAAREVQALFTHEDPGATVDPLASGAPARRSRVEREADAEARLAELKKRFGR
jgi:hypothetical protein